MIEIYKDQLKYTEEYYLYFSEHEIGYMVDFFKYQMNHLNFMINILGENQ